MSFQARNKLAEICGQMLRKLYCGSSKCISRIFNFRLMRLHIVEREQMSLGVKFGELKHGVSEFMRSFWVVSQYSH